MRKAESPIMHGHHPTGVQVKKSPRRVSRVGMDVAERRRVICADREQRQLRGEAASDFAKSREISCVARVVDGMPSRPKHVSAIAAVRILEDSSTPMAGGHMRDRKIAMAIAVPPVQLDNVAEAEIRNQIQDMSRNNDHRRFAASAAVLGDGAQRGAVQMVKVRMRHENNIDSGKVANLNSGLA